MAIEVLKQKHKQKNLVFVFIILVVFVLLVFFFGIKNKGKITTFIPISLPVLEPKKIEIDFSIFENPALNKLEIPEEIGLPEEKGRENPFIPYSVEGL